MTVGMAFRERRDFRQDICLEIGLIKEYREQ